MLKRIHFAFDNLVIYADSLISNVDNIFGLVIET